MLYHWHKHLIPFFLLALRHQIHLCHHHPLRQTGNSFIHSAPYIHSTKTLKKNPPLILSADLCHALSLLFRKPSNFSVNSSYLVFSTWKKKISFILTGSPRGPRGPTPPFGPGSPGSPYKSRDTETEILKENTQIHQIKRGEIIEASRISLYRLNYYGFLMALSCLLRQLPCVSPVMWESYVQDTVFRNETTTHVSPYSLPLSTLRPAAPLLPLSPAAPGLPPGP